MPIEAFVAIAALLAIIFSAQIREAYAKVNASSQDDALKTAKTYVVKILTSFWFWLVVVIFWLFGWSGLTTVVFQPRAIPTAVGEAWEGNPNQPEHMKPNGRENSFNDFNVPNWWIDFSKPKGQESLYRGDGAEGIRSCETNLAAVWGNENGQGGVNNSGPVHRGGTITTLDGTSVAIPTDAIVCTAGPRGTALVLATGPVYQAYEQYRQNLEVTGTVCPTGLKPGQRCLLAPVGSWSQSIPNTDPSTCLRYQGTDPLGTAFSVAYNIGKAGYPADNEWITPAEWMGILKTPTEKPVKEMRFISNTGRPEVVIYEYRQNPGSCFY